MYFFSLIKIRSLSLNPSFTLLHVLKDQTKSLTKVKSCDLSIMHDNNVMLRHKLSFDWLKTYMTL